MSFNGSFVHQGSSHFGQYLNFSHAFNDYNDWGGVGKSILFTLEHP